MDLLGPVSMFGPVATLLGLIASPNSPNREFNSHPADHPPPPPFQLSTPSHPPYPFPPTHPLIYATHDINSGCENVA